MTSPLNGKLMPALAILVVIILAGIGGIAGAQYTQGNIEARVTANERGLDALAPVIRSIDRRLATLEGLALARQREELGP